MATPLGARSQSSSQRKAQHPGDTSATAQVEAALAAYRDVISGALQRQLAQNREPVQDDDAQTLALLAVFYGQMEYHFGWRDAALAPATTNPGKLLRPALVLLSARLFARADDDGALLIGQAMPAAVAVEMVHNFSLIHDDIEDGDEVRRHRPTLWRVWGQPQAINTGDGLYTLARMSLLDLRTTGLPADLVLELAAILDRTCLRLCEGQHLDMSFEGQHDVSPEMYLAMIERKTAALMQCATELGARIGGANQTLAQRMADFGRSLGMGFQLRDDLLGIWASDDLLGKQAAGDLRRKKMTLPVIYALRHATPDDQRHLAALYAAEGPLDERDIDAALGVLDRTEARRHVRGILAEHCHTARDALADAAPTASRTGEAYAALSALVDFIEAEML